MSISREQVFEDAILVLPDTSVTGSIQVIDGLISDISEHPLRRSTSSSTSNPLAIDCGGDYLIPGLVELHTDHLEVHYSPRPGVRWGMISAIQAHDVQVAAAGITTVFDCLRMGDVGEDSFAPGEMKELAAALARARDQNRLRAEHCLHLRCEVSVADVLDDFESFSASPDVGLVSLMDHAPGQRQFTSMEAHRLYHQVSKKMSDEAYADFIADRLALSEKYSDKHRQAISERCRQLQLPMASHDDATVEHVEESIGCGISIAEFPTTLAAAKASHEAGMGVLMGAPNVVRGQSHTGNVAARTLIENNCLDILSSDYVPASLLQAAFMIVNEFGLLSLSEAIALISSNPANKLGLFDRGAIACGRRADLVRVAHYPDQDQAPLVKGVWREGVKVI
ncbi:MAG: alpha-D-ribose 1-methylphosphonate 5-triphosphate diphosphatase [Granulosicoccus sp.]